MITTRNETKATILQMKRFDLVRRLQVDKRKLLQIIVNCLELSYLRHKHQNSVTSKDNQRIFTGVVYGFILSAISSIHTSRKNMLRPSLAENIERILSICSRQVYYIFIAQCRLQLPTVLNQLYLWSRLYCRTGVIGLSCWHFSTL